MRFNRRLQAIIAVAVILALVLSGITFFLRPTTPSAYSLVEQTTLSVLKGRVEYLPLGESTWKEARGGEVLKVGDRVKTGPASHGLITFFEGTTTEIEPGSEVEITRLDKQEATGEIGLGLRQDLGTTWSRVAKIVDVQSRMEIETPSAVAMVRGTEFEVTVTPERRTEVITSVGRVDLMAEGQVISVEAGYLSVVEPGQPPSPPVPAPPPRRALTITLHRAGRLFVTDSRGRSLGFFPETGTYINQIPGAWYSGSRSEPQVIALPEPEETYRIVISPGVRQAVSSRGALVAGWTSDVERAPVPKWVEASSVLAQQTGDYSGDFRVELGVFLTELLVSSSAASGTIDPNEVVSFGAEVEGDQLKGDIVLAHQAMRQLSGMIPQVIAKAELSSPDPMVVANNMEQLIAQVVSAVVANPPKQYQAVVGQSQADSEAQRARLEQVIREAVVAASQHIQESRGAELKTNQGLQAIATMAAVIAPTVQAGATPGASPQASPMATLLAQATLAATAVATVATAAPTVGTAVPTAATVAPTAATPVPTAQPTVQPTAPPTAPPTVPPTAVPTLAPTPVPTAEPTLAPTEEPTVAPTAAPTAVPTTAPTAAPTAAPTEVRPVATAPPIASPEPTASRGGTAPSP